MKQHRTKNKYNQRLYPKTEGHIIRNLMTIAKKIITQFARKSNIFCVKS